VTPGAVPHPSPAPIGGIGIAGLNPVPARAYTKGSRLKAETSFNDMGTET